MPRTTPLFLVCSIITPSFIKCFNTSPGVFGTRCAAAGAFSPPLGHRLRSSPYPRTSLLLSSPASETAAFAPRNTALDPQVFSTGYSSDPDLAVAVQEAAMAALRGLPSAPDGSPTVDLAMVTVSSVYDTEYSPSIVVPTLIGAVRGGGGDEAANYYRGGVLHVVGATAAGIVSTKEGEPVESEGARGASVTLALLPDVRIRTFHLENEDVPEGECSAEEVAYALGLKDFVEKQALSLLLLPHPAFQSSMSDFLEGLDTAFPGCDKFGASASTVSSLSRARLFRHDQENDRDRGTNTLTVGCVGVVLEGDVQVRTMISPGVRAVGPVLRVVEGSGSTVGVVVQEPPGTGEGEKPDVVEDPKQYWPKPTLAEANRVMKLLSDDDAAFMRQALLIGVEQSGMVGSSPSDLERLSKGLGHRYAVYQVASAGMKTGAVTLPLGSVDVSPGMRLRFFVRDGEGAKDEMKALWSGYKKQALEETFATGAASFNPTACMLMPTLDRGTRLFRGKAGYESQSIATYLPDVPSIFGFFSNGVIGTLDGTFKNPDSIQKTILHGSASCYALFGSRTRRPVYSAKELERDEEEQAATKNPSTIAASLTEAAPRDDDGELILRRREIHGGRAISVSTVQWSVADRTATPTSVLEGFMWDKETEVDRLRERVPLANLLSQVKLSKTTQEEGKGQRDLVGPLREARTAGRFAIVPECKRIDPTRGSLRRRYDVRFLARSFESRGIFPALGVNCDGLLFGGDLEDVETVRGATASALPVLVSDLLLYPYQLYRLALRGADAVILVAAALPAKDLSYMAKIAKSLGMQTVLTVTSDKQIDAVVETLKPGTIECIILSNRIQEDFSIDMTGVQAIRMLQGEALARLKSVHGDDVPILVEGRVGVIKGGEENSIRGYVKELQDNGAWGAVVGEAITKLDDATDENSVLRDFLQN